jgi:Tfp pilus assembly protein PilV
MTAGRHKPRRPKRLAAQEGVTLVEVLVGVLVLVVGLLGVFTVFSSSGHSIAAAERTAAMVQVAQNELAATAALPYASIADSLTPTKTSSTDTTNPTYYVSTCSSNTCFQWNPSVSADTETVDVDTTHGKVAPGPTTVVVPAPNTSTCTTANTSTCNITLSVYIFVTETTDSICSQSGVSCSGYSYKRITVAVKNAGTGAPKDPIYLSSFIGSKSGGTNNPLTSGSTNCLDGTTTVSCTH